MGSSQSRKAKANSSNLANTDVKCTIESTTEGVVNNDVKEPEISYISNVPAKYHDGKSSHITTYSGNVTGTRNNYVMNGFGILNLGNNHSISGIFRNNKLELCTSLRLCKQQILECKEFYSNNPHKNIYCLYICKPYGKDSIYFTGYSVIGKFKFQLSDWTVYEKTNIREIFNTTLITLGLCDVFYRDRKYYEIKIDKDMFDLIIGKEYDSNGRIVFDGYFKSNFYTDDVFVKQGEAKIYSYNHGQCVVRKAIYDKGECIVVMIDDEPNDTSEASAPVIE